MMVRSVPTGAISFVSGTPLGSLSAGAVYQSHDRGDDHADDEDKDDIADCDIHGVLPSSIASRPSMAGWKPASISSAFSKDSKAPAGSPHRARLTPRR